MKQIDNYCVMPFRGMQIWTDGSLKPCCMYQSHKHPGKIYSVSEFTEWWGTGLQELRQNFIDGDPPESCSLCFTKKFQNSEVRKHSNQSFAEQIPDYTISQTPETIDITFGNICNLKCIMCGSYSSSRIESEYQQYKTKFNSIGIHQVLVPKKNSWWEDPIQIEKISKIVSNAKYVNFSGGEPLLAPALINLLEIIPDTCFIDINTNCTKLTDRHLEFFNKIIGRISVSLDGIGSHHEYVRYESSWATIENNIYRLLQLTNTKFEISFSYMLQHTSIYSFPKFWEYFKNIPNKIRISEIVPNSIKDNMMTINSVLPEDVNKFKLWHKETPTIYDDIIDTWLDNYQFDPIAHKNFKEYVNMLDDIRGCNFHSTFNPSWI